MSLFAAGYFCLLLSCGEKTSSVNAVPPVRSLTETLPVEGSPIVAGAVKGPARNLDFRNFTYVWPESLKETETFFTLKDGITILANKRVVSLKSIAYENGAEDDGMALVIIWIEDGNATSQILYVFDTEGNAVKPFQAFEFPEDINLVTAYFAHGELVIETAKSDGGDAECCPSFITATSYTLKDDKFVPVGEPQQRPNPYTLRHKTKIQ
jgi:hypothetical protein